MTIEDVDNFTVPVLRKKFKKLIEALDELDMNDELGSEGWRHRLGFED